MVERALILEYLDGEFSIVANDAGAGMTLRLRMQGTLTEQHGRDASPVTLLHLSVSLMHR